MKGIFDKGKLHMESKLLKSYKGFMIEKSWEEWSNGTKHNIVYTAYTEDGNVIFDAAKTLSELKKKIDGYMKGKE